MIITVFGATGQVGKRAVQQALAEGHTVRAFGRNIVDLIDKDLHEERFHAIKGHVFDEAEVLEAITGSNAIISTLGGSFDGKDKTRSLGIKNIIAQMEKAGVQRIVALGGLGVLDTEDGTNLIDAPGYPLEYKPVGLEHLQAYLYLKESNLDWTFVCSPNILNEDRTGNYITNADYPPTPNKGAIAAGDLADFMLKELKDNEFLKKKVGISRL
jgi:putative NADH-flavin reductase